MIYGESYPTLLTLLRFHRIKVFLYVLLRDLVFTIDSDLVIERKVK